MTRILVNQRFSGSTSPSCCPHNQPASTCSNSIYREWVKDASHITCERLRRTKDFPFSAGAGGEGSPSAKNNAAAAGTAGSRK
jgi:hypothetical protein